MKVTEMREMSIEELKNKVQEHKRTLNKMKIDHAVVGIEKTSEFKRMRREIAQMLTIITEKERNNQSESK
ncbi:MAG: 50S ribosomal protein L29 [Bacteroidia bacterium]|nr:50S ribosomal protein L29 [Bacteroidia bacterium]MDW8346926.1 50S ribosomal protein L29 [Bacteroidia bacterium]